MDLPATPQQTPGFPSNVLPLLFEKFSTLDTKPSRPGIRDEEMSWCDGIMPLGVNNARTLYGVGDSLYTAVTPDSIVRFGFGNAAANPADAGMPISIVFLANGSIEEVDVNTSVVTQIAPAGTLTTTQIGQGQFGSQYIIIVANQTNGYFLWDRANFYTSGTLAPNITVTDGGSGYTSAPAVGITGGSGTGAAATATVENGMVVSITITNPGSGYVIGDTVTIGFSGGGGSGATATGNIMPFGVQGTSVETYTNRVWVGNFDTITYSAPSSVSNFASADGGGTFTSNNSFLRVGFTQLKQSNGFLYTIADSSINYISGVQTSGSPAATTFNSQNVDPQIGTPYADTVQVFSRNVVFANAQGVHVSYGGAVTKVSDALDGFFNSVTNFGGSSLSSAVANIFGRAVYMVLVPVIDIYTSQQVNKLCMWDGKRWWTSQQDVDLVFVASQEINSVLTAWGTDGTTIYPLFQEPSSGFQKVIQSKLWATPSYYFTKTPSRISGVLNFFQQSSEFVNFTIDNQGSSTATSPIEVSQNSIAWTNDVGDPIVWTNDASDPIEWFGPGLTVFTQALSQHGTLIGGTMYTNHPDVALVSATILDINFQTNV